MFMGGVCAADSNATSDSSDDVLMQVESADSTGNDAVLEVSAENDTQAVSHEMEKINVSEENVDDDFIQSGNVKNVADPVSEDGDVLSSSADNPVLGANAPGGDFKSLRNLIDDNNQLSLTGSYTADAGDFIGLGILINRAVERTGISISKTLTIQGNGVYYIDADSRCRIFNIQSGTVTFRNVIFRNGGYNNYAGGAITIASGATVTFENCIFESCTAGSSNGGAVSSSSNNVIFNGCTFRSNTASNGGAVYYTQTSATAKLRFTDCTFESNRASGSSGSAIYSLTNDTEIKDCTFKNNYVSATGSQTNGLRGTASLIRRMWMP